MVSLKIALTIPLSEIVEFTDIFLDSALFANGNQHLSKE